jgi:hypothetical protein
MMFMTPRLIATVRRAEGSSLRLQNPPVNHCE